MFKNNAYIVYSHGHKSNVYFDGGKFATGYIYMSKKDYKNNELRIILWDDPPDAVWLYKNNGQKPISAKLIIPYLNFEINCRFEKLK